MDKIASQDNTSRSQKVGVNNKIDQYEQALTTLKQSVSKCLNSGDAGRILVNYLKNIVEIVPYTPGISLEQLSYLEGQRCLAKELLLLGGIITNYQGK